MDPRPADIFLIAGGPKAENTEAILSQVISRSKIQPPRVAYIGAASNDHHAFFLRFKKLLTAAGAKRVQLVPMARRFDRDKAQDMLQASDIIFISGGDVLLGMRALRSARLEAFLEMLYREGKLFCGVSAGAIMLCRHWLHWREPDDDNTAEIFDCLGLAPLLCDVHAEEDGWGEMKKLLSFFPQGTAGYAIPSGGALQVAADGSVSSIGTPSLRIIL